MGEGRHGDEVGTGAPGAAGSLDRLAARTGLDVRQLAVETAFAAAPELAVVRALDLRDHAREIARLDPSQRRALFSLLGGSAHLSRVLSAEARWSDWIRDATAGIDAPPELDGAALVRSGLEDPAAGASGLRRWRQRAYLRLGARDLWGLARVAETLARLSDLADTAIAAAAALARAEVERDFGALTLAGGRPNRFVVLGLGKLGARELNYSSDVDLVFVHESDGAESAGGTRGRVGANAWFTRMAERITRLLAEVTSEGFVFRVDLRLRPDGRNGPITTSLLATLQYYERLGETWERTALFKARPVGGDLALGDELLAELAPFIHRRTLDFAMIEELERMKRRVEREVSGPNAARNVKLGPGGIREVEFFAQSFAMVHGGRDARMRERSTLRLLDVLAATGRVPQDEARLLGRAYRWLRRVEHALQLDEDRQLHTLPADDAGLRTVARRLACHLEGHGPVWERAPRDQDLEIFLAGHAHWTGVVRRAFSELFRERRQSTFSLADEEARRLVEDLDDPAIEARLCEAGFARPSATRLNLLLLRDGGPGRALGTGTRRALRALAPALLATARRTGEPDRVVEKLAAFLAGSNVRRGFIALLAENPGTLELVASVFAHSEYLTRLLGGHPELLDTLVRSDLAVVQRPVESMREELAERLIVASDEESRLDALRRFRADEFLRIGIHDIQDELHWSEVGRQLSDLAEVCLGGAEEMVRRHFAWRGVEPPGQDMAIVALGKLGGRELNYHSDLDLIFVYGPSEPGREAPDSPPAVEAQEFFVRRAQRLLGVLQVVTREGFVYKIDTRLRPSGRSGTLVSSLDGFTRYHAGSSATWERQALTRARVVAGPPALARRIEEVISRFVFGRGLADEERAEIARLRWRMERELAREDATHIDLKMGAGSQVDIEFMAQVMALAHGHEHPELRRRATREILDGARSTGVLSPELHETLTRAHSFFRGLDNRLRIEGEHPVERIECTPARLASAARRMGFTGTAEQTGRALLEELGRHRLRVREIYDRLVGRFRRP